MQHPEEDAREILPGDHDMTGEDEFLVSLLRARSMMYAHFGARDVQITGGNIRFEADRITGDTRKLRAEFREAGFTMHMHKHGGRTIVTLVRRAARRDAGRRREMITALTMFALTLVTTFMAGMLMSYGLAHSRAELYLNAFYFSAALIAILGSHELAHKFAAIRNGIESSPPYFIPAPVFKGFIGFGTFGAVIRIKTPMPDENAAIELGLSGPVAGFLVTIPVLIAGVMLSPHVPQSSLPTANMIEFGEPLLFKLIAYVLLRIPASDVVILHPLGFAGWVGMLVTMINLFPIGQLDGGHIARAMLGRRLHQRVSRICIAALFALGAYTQYFGWFIWGALCIWILSRGYPGGTGVIAPFRKRNIAYGILALIILILCFMPAPITIR